MANPGSATVVGHGHAHHDAQMEARRQMQQAHEKQIILMGVEFEKEELAAPDYDGGHRQYHMDPTDTDLETLQEHLEHLNKLRGSEAKELAYVWQTLALKERVMHQLSQENPEKDLLRRELQLLNSIATHSNSRLAIISYAQADARKRIAQISNEDPTPISKLPLAATEESPLDDNWRKTYIPQKTAERIRQRWEDARTDMAHIEHVLTQFDELKAQGSTNSHVNEQAERLRVNHGHLKQNVVATERLLKEFEDQIHEADANNGK